MGADESASKAQIKNHLFRILPLGKREGLIAPRRVRRLSGASRIKLIPGGGERPKNRSIWHTVIECHFGLFLERNPRCMTRCGYEIACMAAGRCSVTCRAFRAWRSSPQRLKSRLIRSHPRWSDTTTKLETEKMKRATLVSFVVLILAGGAGAKEEEWRAQTSALFEVFADAMVSAKYSGLFEAFDIESSDEYRQLMLVQYSLMSAKERSRLPAGEEGKPLTVEELRDLTNSQFWDVHISAFRKIEGQISNKLRAAHGPLGTPKYTLHRAFRDGDGVYMLVEKTFDIPARAPLPYEVLEAVLEKGQWKLRVPRGMTWQIQEAISKAKQQSKTGG